MPCSVSAICCCSSASAARGRRDRRFERGQRRLRGRFLAPPRLARRERGFERRVGRRAVVGERGLLPGERAERLGQLRDLLRDARLAISRANASCCSSRVTSALAA